LVIDRPGQIVYRQSLLVWKGVPGSKAYTKLCLDFPKKIHNPSRMMFYLCCSWRREPEREAVAALYQGTVAIEMLISSLFGKSIGLQKHN